MAASLKEHQRTIRKESLRELLSKQKHLQQACDIANNFEEQTERVDQDRLKIKFDMHMRLVDKYLPSLKATEITGDMENPLVLLVRELSGESTGLPEPSDD